MTRLYYCGGGLFAVDHGVGTPSAVTRRVQVLDCYGVTRYDPGADNGKEPRAWLEFDARYEVHDNEVVIRTPIEATTEWQN